MRLHYLFTSISRLEKAGMAALFLAGSLSGFNVYAQGDAAAEETNGVSKETATETFGIEDKSSEAMELSEHKFHLLLGGYVVTNADMTVSLTERNTGAGISISPEDTLGIDIQQSVGFLGGYYRFTPVHRLDFSWYRLSSDGYKSLESDFDWVDPDGEEITISAGSQVTTQLSYDILKLAYEWSFYHNDKVEMYTTTGLNITRFKIALDVMSSVNAEQEISTEDVSLS